MVLVLSLVALVLLIGLTVRGGFRDLQRVEARRDVLVRAAEREQRRLTGDQS